MRCHYTYLGLASDNCPSSPFCGCERDREQSALPDPEQPYLFGDDT